jgi:hypothetical protein
VDAGADATVQLPEDSVALDATVTDDGLPSNTVTVAWSVSSAPDGATVTFADENAEDTTATFDLAGVYVLELTASDSELEGSDTVQVTVEPEGGAGNTPPTADSQSVTTDADTPLAITLTGTDPDGDTLTFAIVTGPTSGTLSGTAPDVTYTPNAGFSGEDSFTFTVNDGLVESAEATVTITVEPAGAVNTPPTADSQSVTTATDTPRLIVLTGTDPDGDALTFAIATGPTSGTLSSIAPDRTVTYTPNANFVGQDSFTFTVNDGLVDSAEATVSVTVGLLALGFTDITSSAGTAGPDDGGHGVMFADANGDGQPDLYLTNLFQNTGERRDYYFRNQGGGSFAEEAERRGIDDVDGGSHGAAWADLDNDGDYDLVNGSTWSWDGAVGGTFGFPESNNVYRNDGAGNFTDVTPASMDSKVIETRGVATFDFDGDGDLDVFGVPGSQAQILGVNEAFLNEGDFGFRFYNDDGGDLGTADATQGVIDTDLDSDGDIDVLAANRGGPFAILINDGSGVFRNRDPSSYGITDKAGDGITAADVDNDGDLDLLLVSDGSGWLYFQQSPGVYVQQRPFSGVEGYMGGFADLDNDGDLDLVFAGDNEVYVNRGDGTFTAGPSLPTAGIRDPRAVAFADVDNDGDVDFAFAAKGSRNWLIRNDFDGGNWLKVGLVSPQGMAGAFGARTRIYRAGQAGQPGALLGLRESRSNYGYLAQDDPVLHFGLGANTVVDVVVTFADGSVITRRNVSANQQILVDGR